MQTRALLAGLCAAALLSACLDRPVGETHSPSPPPLAPEAMAPPANTAGQGPAAMLRALLSPEGIGMHLAYIEKHAGPAQRTDGHTHTFELARCVLELTTDAQNRTVQHIRLTLSPTCGATGDGLMLSASPPMPLHALSVKAFSEQYGPGAFTADCLRGCGNAHEPSIHYTATGPRANGFLKVALELPLVDDAVLEAADQWEDAMLQREGEDWLIDARFNCEGQAHQDVAMRAMGHLKPAYLSVGEPRITHAC